MTKMVSNNVLLAISLVIQHSLAQSSVLYLFGSIDSTPTCASSYCGMNQQGISAACETACPSEAPKKLRRGIVARAACNDVGPIACCQTPSLYLPCTTSVPNLIGSATPTCASSYCGMNQQGISAACETACPFEAPKKLRRGIVARAACNDVGPIACCQSPSIYLPCISSQRPSPSSSSVSSPSATPTCNSNFCGFTGDALERQCYNRCDGVSKCVQDCCGIPSQYLSCSISQSPSSSSPMTSSISPSQSPSSPIASSTSPTASSISPKQYSSSLIASLTLPEQSYSSPQLSLSSSRAPSSSANQLTRDSSSSTPNLSSSLTPSPSITSTSSSLSSSVLNPPSAPCGFSDLLTPECSSLCGCDSPACFIQWGLIPQSCPDYCLAANIWPYQPNTTPCSTSCGPVCEIDGFATLLQYPTRVIATPVYATTIVDRVVIYLDGVTSTFPGYQTQPPPSISPLPHVLTWTFEDLIL
jgi:hypothetical protein